MSDRYKDLGGGVFDDGRPETPPMLSNGRRPTCPRCGETDDPQVDVVDHPNGRFLCGCGTLFNGGDIEWRQWTRARRQFRKIAAGEYEVMPPARHEKKRKPIAQRLQESNVAELRPKEDR